MSRLTLLVLVSIQLTLIASHTTIDAQRRTRRPPPSDVVAPARPLPAKPIILKEIDQESGSTLVKMEPMALPPKKGIDSTFSVGAEFFSKGIALPDFINLTFFSRAAQCRFPAKADIKLSLDRVPMNLRYIADAPGKAWSERAGEIDVYRARSEGILWVQSVMEETGLCGESMLVTLTPGTFFAGSSLQKRQRKYWR